MSMSLCPLAEGKPIEARPQQLRLLRQLTKLVEHDGGGRGHVERVYAVGDLDSQGQRVLEAGEIESVAFVPEQDDITGSARKRTQCLGRAGAGGEYSARGGVLQKRSGIGDQHRE